MPKQLVTTSGSMYPNPIILLTVGHDLEANIITLAWAGTLCGNPWMVGIGVRPARHSYHLLLKYREFVINVPTTNLIKAVQLCGSKSGRDCNKWLESALTPDPSHAIKTPAIAQCPVSLECRLRHTLDLGQHTLFIGEVLATRRDPAWNFNPPPPVYLGGDYYTLDPTPIK